MSIKAIENVNPPLQVFFQRFRLVTAYRVLETHSPWAVELKSRQ